MHQERTGVASDSRESTFAMHDSLRVEPRILVSVANVAQSDLVGPQEVGSVRNRDVSPGILSSLIAQLIQAAQEDNPAEVKVPPDAGTWGPTVAPFPETSAQSPVLEAEPVMVCFSCGYPGHGVNPCCRVGTSFSFLPPGWLVAVQDGQYRAVWPGGPITRYQSRNEGCSGWEGQLPGPAVTVGLLTPAGGACCPVKQGTNRYGCHRLGMRMSPVGLQVCRLFHHWGVIHWCFPQGNTNGVTGRLMFWPSRSRDRRIGLFETLRLRWACLQSLFTPVSGARRSGRGMRPARWNSRSPSCGWVVTENSMVSGGKTGAVEKLDSFSDDVVVKKNVGDAPLPGDDVNAHPVCVPSLDAAEKNRQKGYRNSVPPQDVTGEAFGLNDAAVLTPAVAGAASSAVFAGAVAPADLAGMLFPAVAGMEFPSVLVNRSGMLPGGSPD